MGGVRPITCLFDLLDRFAIFSPLLRQYATMKQHGAGEEGCYKVGASEAECNAVFWRCWSSLCEVCNLLDFQMSKPPVAVGCDTPPYPQRDFAINAYSIKQVHDIVVISLHLLAYVLHLSPWPFLRRTLSDEVTTFKPKLSRMRHRLRGYTKIHKMHQEESTFSKTTRHIKK